MISQRVGERLLMASGIGIIVLLISIPLHELGHMMFFAIHGIPSRLVFTQGTVAVDVNWSMVAEHLWIPSAMAGGLFVFALLIPFALRWRFLLWIPLAHLWYAMWEPLLIFEHPLRGYIILISGIGFVFGLPITMAYYIWRNTT